MQYWINQDGVQTGPVAREELERMGLTARAYVWREGLDDWVKVTALPELASLIAAPAVPPVPAVDEAIVPPVPAVNEDIVPEVPAVDEAIVPPVPAVNEEIAPEVPAVDEAAEPAVPAVSEAVAEPVEAAPSIPPLEAAAVPPLDGPQYAAAVPPALPMEECPPTNLVWGIIVTILCCLPAGVVAIVYASKVSRLYREGDLDGARRASDIGAWWCIGGIVAGIIAQPIVSLMML